MTAAITVPAVAAALLTVPRDCETCENAGWDFKAYDESGQQLMDPVDSYPCPDCRMVCSWLAVDDPLEVGSTIHIVAGPVDEYRSDVAYARAIGSWVVLHGNDDIPLRPGVVVATGVVTECVPIHAEPPDPTWYEEGGPAWVENYPGADDLVLWPLGNTMVDNSDQRLDQDWSPTRPCHGAEGVIECCGLAIQGGLGEPCPVCADGGSLPRYAIRLTDVEAQP
jgi:hypothetical protein